MTLYGMGRSGERECTAPKGTQLALRYSSLTIAAAGVWRKKQRDVPMSLLFYRRRSHPKVWLDQRKQFIFQERSTRQQARQKRIAAIGV
jgi:hypothetical protein